MLPGLKLKGLRLPTLVFEPAFQWLFDEISARDFGHWDLVFAIGNTARYERRSSTLCSAISRGQRRGSVQLFVERLEFQVAHEMLLAQGQKLFCFGLAACAYQILGIQHQGIA